MLDANSDGADSALRGKRPAAESLHEDLDAVSTKAEAGLSSEAGVIEEQARHVQPLKEGENLLPRISPLTHATASNGVKIPQNEDRQNEAQAG